MVTGINSSLWLWFLRGDLNQFQSVALISSWWLKSIPVSGFDFFVVTEINSSDGFDFFVVTEINSSLWLWFLRGDWNQFQLVVLISPWWLESIPVSGFDFFVVTGINSSLWLWFFRGDWNQIQFVALISSWWLKSIPVCGFDFFVVTEINSS